MPIIDHGQTFDLLDAAVLEQWHAIPPAIASDCMNRTQAMTASVNPITPDTTLCGQARTVACMTADNSAIHAAVRMVRPGEVLVVSAGGFADTALFGGLLAEAALIRGVAGIVIDGAVRDVAEIRELGFPCYCSAVVPAGPHKGHGGSINATIACGGCPVSSGDLVLGDDDGIAIVPLGRQEQVLKASIDKIAQEEAALELIRAGGSFADHLGIPEPEKLD